jgi:ADP-ribose pyrophosphatase YjhB (NUDIX family)
MIARSLAGWLRSGALMRLVHWRALVVAPLTLGVRGLVIDAEARIFLVRHSYTGGWHLPGGGVEIGESTRDALARELREEGNIVLDEVPPLHGLYFNNRYSRRDHVAVFVVRRFHQTAARAPDWEITGADFFAPEELPEDIAPAVRRTLAEVLEGAAIREIW